MLPKKISTTAELVFGSPLGLPGQMVEKDVSTTQELKNRMTNLEFTPARTAQKTIFIPKTLNNCNFVFLRRDAVKNCSRQLIPVLSELPPMHQNIVF